MNKQSPRPPSPRRAPLPALRAMRDRSSAAGTGISARHNYRSRLEGLPAYGNTGDAGVRRSGSKQGYEISAPCRLYPLYQSGAAQTFSRARRPSPIARAGGSHQFRVPTRQVRNALIADPKLAQGSHRFWLPASDTLDRAFKNRENVNTPESARKITNRQLAWLDALRADGSVRLRFNPWFFLAGDSREPELAGFAVSHGGIAVHACSPACFWRFP